MEVQKNQVNRVRTFKDDLARAQGVTPTPPAPTPVPAAPAPQLPPVLVPPKPLPPVRPAKIEPAPIIEHIKADPDIEADLRSLSKGQSPIDNERLNIMDADDVVADGTIITDQKRERFKLLPAMWEATKGWVDQGQKAWEEKKVRELAAVPKVSKIENRQEIVKKAAMKSALSPKDDHREVVKRLPEALPAIAPKPSVVIKKKDPEAAPNWSHFEGQPEAPKPEPVVPKTTEILATITSAPPVIPPPPRKMEPPPKPEPVAPPVEIKVAPVAPPASPAPPVEAPKPQPRFAPPRPQGRRFPAFLRYGALSLVAIGALGGGAALMLWLFPGSEPSFFEPPVTTTLPRPENTLVSNTKLIQIPLPSRRADLYATMLSTAEIDGQISFIPTTGGAEASSAEVIDVLDLRADAAFLRSLKHVEFGGFDGKLFIVAEVTSFDTAFGGLLASERNLSENFDPIFGPAVKESVAVDGEGNSIVTIPRFRDDVAGNHDIRVLEDDLGNERLVYGFTDRNTLILAPDRATFEAVARLAR